MYTVLMTTMLSLPIFPLNPVQQDTLDQMSFHFTAGIASPSEMFSVGPEMTVKYEFLFKHPFMIRTGLDYRFGRMNQLKYPNGNYHGFTTSAEFIHYRGTTRMTGFIGIGIVYNFSKVGLDDEVADSVWTNESISDVRFEPSLGYRVIFGVRRSRLWSFEVRITDIRTNLVFERDLGPNRFSLERQKVKLGDIRISLGYLLPFSKH
jgi:hypothetical protein